MDFSRERSSIWMVFGEDHALMRWLEVRKVFHKFCGVECDRGLSFTD